MNIFPVLFQALNILVLQTIKEEGSTVYMSDSVGRCNGGQRAKVKQTDGSGTLTLSLNGTNRKHLSLVVYIES